MKNRLRTARIKFLPRGILLQVIFLLMATGPAGAATLELTGPDGTAVSVNGQAMGFLPLARVLDLRAGTYQIRAELPGHQPFVISVRLKTDDDWQRLQIRPIPYNKGTAWRSNILFAGLGQHYLDKPFKGYLFNVLEAGGLLTALVAELNRANYESDYLLLLARYESSINANDIAYYKAKSEETYGQVQDMETLRNNGLLVAGGAIVLSVLDAILLFPNVEVGPGPVEPTTSFNTAVQAPDHFFSAAHAGVKLSF